MTEATDTPVQTPQRWSIGNYDGYMVESDGGDYVEVEAVEPLIAEINRLRAEVERLQTINSQASKIIQVATDALVTIGMSPNGHIAVSTMHRIEQMLRVP